MNNQMMASSRHFGGGTAEKKNLVTEGKGHKPTNDGKQDGQLGEVRIKYTDCSKATMSGDV